MRRSKLELDPDDERLVAVVRHMHLVRRFPMRGIVAELEAMGLVDSRGRPFPLSLVWTIVYSMQPPRAVPR
jgi:hypothetical protein